ncbi:Hsp20/alpha crystallin family protein [Holophaga foetida]|uniref:Hsp20/alpha crystallin family protein n=1 Tax=Holophaga foetida TaxID=35839 RepID=UPI0002473309|nr:HSP20 family small heat-shock protein [Holophaga foetida]
MNLIRRGTRNPAFGTTLEPFALMRDFMRWAPFRDTDLGTELSAFVPSFDIKETGDAYVFAADLPGVKRDDLDINLTGNRLTIAGRREAESRREGENVFTCERAFGHFSRTFTLPDGVDAAGVRAEIKDGVLTLTVPKVPEVQPRKITIAAS